MINPDQIRSFDLPRTALAICFAGAVWVLFSELLIRLWRRFRNAAD